MSPLRKGGGEMIEIQSNYSGFFGFRYSPVQMWKQRMGKNGKPLLQVFLIFTTINIDMPFNHLAKKQFGSKSESYGAVTNFKGYSWYYFGGDL